MTDNSRKERRPGRRLKLAFLSIIALALIIGFATHLWSHTLQSKAARIEIGHSRNDVETILGSPVAIATALIRKGGDGRPPTEYVTESYDPTFGTKVMINNLFDSLGWSPFDLDQTEWPVRVHFDDDDRVDMIQRGDEIIRK
jgi:hypothetical protein